MALFAVAGLLVALSWAAATTQLNDDTSCSSVSLADSCESYLNSSATTDSPPSSCCVSVRGSISCFCSLDENSREDFLKLAPHCGITSFSANCSSSSSSSTSTSTSTPPASPSASPSAPSPSTGSTPADATPTTPPDSGSQHTPSQAKPFPIKVIAAVVGVVCVLAIAVAIFCRLKRRARMKNNASDPESGDDANSLLKKKAMPTHAALDPESVMGGSRNIDLLTTESLQYDLIILKEATEDFSESNKIGRGAFGIVYKGVLANGKEIAVKRLTTYSEHNTEEFKNEVSLVARLQHNNLVSLMGFCLDGEEKLLVFEFVPNKSLDHFLFEDQEKRKQLDWRRRYEIIKGITRGLLYLHEDSRHRIIHRDLKAANILLDANMIPKISDFGTARLVHKDNSCMETSQIAGTRGYMAPEYVLHGQYSAKSDVYSFGVLILEIISGSSRVRSSDQSGMSQDLLNDAWNCWSDGEALKFMDETLASSYYSSIEVMKCIQLGLLCVEQNPDDRPTMASVINTLNNISTINLRDPQQPICFNTLVAESSSNSSEKWTTAHKSEVTNP